MYEKFYIFVLSCVCVQCYGPFHKETSKFLKHDAAKVPLTQPPNIIVILADDLGWNDVGFHGSNQIPTPNLDALAYSGIILNNYYTQSLCSPSRAALMTGKYPFRTGLQHEVIYGPTSHSIPLNMTILPQYLASLGYKNHAVGKWHLGHAYAAMTPTNRGFDSFYGYWTGRHDYYDHTAFESPGWWGYDFRRDMHVERLAFGKYTTDLLSNETESIIANHDTSRPLFLYLAHLAVHSGNPYEPLQAPEDLVKKFEYIEDVERRKFAAMLWKFDEAVGRLVTSLEKRGMLENSVLLFSSDNGGAAGGFNLNAASNWPLRGVKGSMWEGGTRVSGFLWSPLLKSSGRVSQQMIHITDWLPTLYSAAGGDVKRLGDIDGKDMWKILSSNSSSNRKEFVVSIDQISKNFGIRMNDWKLIFNAQNYGPQWDGWFGSTGRNESFKNWSSSSVISFVKSSPAARAILKFNPLAFRDVLNIRKKSVIKCHPIPSNATPHCNSPSKPCLFNLAEDPCEYYDVATENSDLVSNMRVVLKTYFDAAVPPANTAWDPKANPIAWDYTWTNWKDSISDVKFRPLE